MNPDPLNGLRQWLGGLPQWLTFSFSNDHIWFPQLHSSPCPCTQMPSNTETTQAADSLLVHTSTVGAWRCQQS